MTSVYFFTILINGLRLGSIYALIAIGYSMVYGILKLINFAHGDIMTLGVYFILVQMDRMGLPLPQTIVLSVAISIAVGLIMERLAYRPLRTADEEATLISSLAVSTLLQNLTMMLFTAQRQPFKLPQWLSAQHEIGAFRLSTINILTFVVTIVALVILTIVIRKTKIGIAMRACSENLNAAKLMGINVNKVVMFTFAVGSGLAVIAGLMLSGEYQTVYPSLGFVPSLKAFCAAVIGGIGSLGGSVIGGVLIGIAEMMFSGLMPTAFTNYRDAFVFALMIIVLLFRPNGLFGSKEGGRS
ncbi:MAG: branched-chain amino acid ABC transporter permease [Oscillospiraceae bacterium]|nr:branched-chain amino acid ABC transporter permease [Oscillospiraceae bacterium]